jgi:hypothetical protein
MTDDTPPGKPAAPAEMNPKAAAREARRSAALRENLFRRKEAARARSSAETIPPTKTTGDA